MSDENRRLENSEIISSSDDEGMGQVGVSHEKFSLKSSQIQPFDFERMSGRPTNLEKKHTSDNASNSASDSNKK